MESTSEESDQEHKQIKYLTPKFNSYLFITVCFTVFTIYVFLKKPNYFLINLLKRYAFVVSEGHGTRDMGNGNNGGNIREQ